MTVKNISRLCGVLMADTSCVRIYRMFLEIVTCDGSKRERAPVILCCSQSSVPSLVGASEDQDSLYAVSIKFILIEFP